MSKKQLLSGLLYGALVLTSGHVFAIGDAAKVLQDQWAEAKYQTPEKGREAAFEKLAARAEQVADQNGDDAEVLTWEAIILSSYAGEKGGLGALGLVKRAKTLLEKAEGINGGVLDGAVYTTLGSLYYQVPGWPIGFGSDKKAESYLRKGLSVAPNDIDANYFWGDFLLSDKRYKEAVSAFEKALSAPARPGREAADLGRKEEIRAALAKARAKL